MRLTITLCCLLFATLTTTAQAARPNIVVFLADDQGWGDLSLHDNPQISTPHIDSLARQGAAFDRFYVCPVCAPTRAEFFTGRYHLRTGVYGVSTGQERLNLDEHTIFEAFQQAGYATGVFGKWHNGSQWPYHPNARGIEEYYGFTSGHWGEYFDPPLEHNGEFVRGSGYLTDDLTDHAIHFIEQHQEQPFFCYLPYNIPHSPFAVPDSYWQRFKDKPITRRGRDGSKEAVDITRCTLAMCENVDWNVGRVLKRLDELQLAENTIVIYFSDNGPNSWRYNGGMKGRKGSTDEGGVRSPMFIRWPAKIPAGRKIEPIAGAIDLLPTLTSLTGIERVGDKPLDGIDLSPLLVGKGEQEWSDRQIISHWRGRVSVRTQQYRLGSKGELYDMVADPLQKHNIADQQPEATERLAAAVKQFREEVPRTNKDRPFPVGYAEFPMTPLPARDGVPHGQVKRSTSAPNCSYFVNWSSTEDRITWDCEVQTSGKYEVAIWYTAPKAGSLIELSFLDSKLQGTVAPAWNPPLYDDQDTLPRPNAESTMKEFHRLELGTIELEQGRGPLTLRALKVVGKSAMDVRRVTLTLVE